MKNRFQFAPGELPPEAYDYKAVMVKFNVSKAEAKGIVQHHKDEKTFVSSVYQVNVSETRTGFGPMTWLSVKRRDKAAFHDWREMQQIKNAIVGPEREAMELYPAESRLVDTANQYHLWVLPEGATFPLGFPDREIITESKHGAVQRSFEITREAE